MGQREHIDKEDFIGKEALVAEAADGGTYRLIPPPVSQSGLAGTPATVMPAGTSLVTTAPAPTMAPAPIETPGRTVAPAASQAWSPMRTPPQTVAEGEMVT